MIQPEVDIVSRYSAAELAGALLLGKFARRTEDPFLRGKLTQHCNEETRHSWLWAKFLLDKGFEIKGFHERDDYFTLMHEAPDEVSLLVAVHVYEMRVPFHFAIHAGIPSVDKELKTLIEQIADDEKYHLSWVHKYLTSLQDAGDTRVREAIKIAGELEDKVYRSYIAKMKEGDAYTKEIALSAEKQLDLYPYAWKSFLK